MTPPSVPPADGDPASPEPLTVGDILRRHPDLAPSPRASTAPQDIPRWKGLVSFTILLALALGGAALAADIASGAAIVGSGLGGQRVELVDVGGLRGVVGRIAEPAAAAGRSVSVVGGDHGDGTYYLWPTGSSFAYERGWSFVLGDWIPLVVMVLCLVAVGVIVRVLVRLVRNQPV